MSDKIIKIMLVLLLLSAITIQAQNLKMSKNIQQSQAKVFVVLEMTVHDSVMYEQYRIKVEPMIKEYGGKYLVRAGRMSYEKGTETKIIPLEGNWNPDRLIIVEWNSVEQFKKFANSEEYHSIVNLRRNSATTKSVIVKEYLVN